MLIFLANPEPQALNRLVTYPKAELQAFPLQFHLISISSLFIICHVLLIPLVMILLEAPQVR